MDLHRDLWHGMRRLRRAPGFAAVAIVSLALGIGANTAVFSLVNAVILRMAPVHQPEELVVVATNNFAHSLNYPFYESVQGDVRFAGLLCSFATPVNASTGAAAQRVEAELVSGTYFPVLGVQPSMGRLLTPEDDRVRLGHPIVVVSHAYWRQHLQGDTAAIGRPIRINGHPYTVVGVAAPGFSGLQRGFDRHLFVPMRMKARVTPGWDGLDKPHIVWLRIAGRLKPGVDRVALGHELNARLHALQAPYLAADHQLSAAQKKMIRSRKVYVESLGAATLDARVARHLKLAAVAVGALLLLACVNLAGLLLSRGLERQREIATRLAVGASRFRIARQLAAESLLIAVLGSAAGLLLGAWMAPAVASRYPVAGPGSSYDVPLDATVLVYTLGISVLACVVFAVLPAWRGSGLDLGASLKGLHEARGGAVLRHVLLGGEAALAMMLLVVAVLFSLNLDRLLRFDSGFARQRLLVAALEPALNGYEPDQRLRLYRDLQSRLDAATAAMGSAFTEAALSNVAPMSPWTWGSLFVVQGRRGDDQVMPNAVAVGPGYFETMRIPLIEGRVLTARDDERGPRVALISESLARREFPSGNAIGQRFLADHREQDKAVFEIVGVVADVVLNDPRRRDLRECVYLPYRQIPFPPQAIVIQARLSGANPAPAVATLRSIVGDLDPGLALHGIKTVDEVADSMLGAERLVALMTALFGVVAALLVGIGLHGMLSREVAARRREIGIRCALGASWRHLAFSLYKRTFVWLLAGYAVGGVCLIAMQPWLSSVLSDAEPWALMPWIWASLALAGVTAVAVAGPLLRAGRVNPAAALRAP